MQISVIIPVKNRAHLLPVTLDNVLRQTLRPYEVIVVDDESTDNIDKVIKEYRKKVIFIKSDGKGPGAGRNTGLKVATGDLIQFFDSDDLMTKNKLKEQAALLYENDADFVYGPFVKAKFENNHWVQEDVIMQYYPLKGNCLANYVLQGWCNIFQSALFTRALVNEAGKWNEDIFTHEDYEYWFRIGQLTNKFVHENNSCVIYRQHQQQVTDLQTIDKQKWRNEIAALELMKQEIIFKPSMHSLLLFRGRECNAKKGYKQIFKDDFDVEIKNQHRFLVPYFKFFGKLGRIQTVTNWQKMHGVLKKTDKFQEYLSNLG